MTDFEQTLQDKREELANNLEPFALEQEKYRIEKNYYVLNKQFYTSQKNNVTCKLNYYEPKAIFRGQGANAFHGVVVNTQYVDRRYYEHLSVGMFTFVYELDNFGHQMHLVAIKPYQG